MKKPTSSVRFRFYKLETKKTESNWTESKPKKPKKKPSQTGKKTSQTEPKPEKLSQTGKNWVNPEKTEPDWFEPVFILKNQTEPNQIETGRFKPILVYFLKFLV